MKKFEGIVTLCGVLVIVGMPLFLMFANFGASERVSFGDEYIKVLSYDEVSNTIDTDFEQSYPALDGTEGRDEIVYLFNDIEELNTDINEQIVSFNDDVAPLAIDTNIEELEEIEPLDLGPVIEEYGAEELVDEEINKDENETSEEFGDIEEEIEILIEDVIPEGLLIETSEEDFGEDEEPSEELDETSPISISSEDGEEDLGILFEDPEEEEYIDIPEDKMMVVQETEFIDEETPEAINTAEDFGDDEDYEEDTLETFNEDDIPEGLSSLDNLEVNENDGITEVRYQDADGNLVIFSY